jgi:hypothetical protein
MSIWFARRRIRRKRRAIRTPAPDTVTFRYQMRQPNSGLKNDDYVLLALAALQPISLFPPLHWASVKRLEAWGYLKHLNGLWHPTPDGLAATKRVSH